MAISERNDPARAVERTFLTLTLLSTLASSFIWGINTIFLLDAGLNNAEAFAANAFFTAGMVIFEIPTGIVADTRGRQLSYVLGAATLLFSTLLYLLMWQLHAPLWGWASPSSPAPTRRGWSTPSTRPASRGISNTSLGARRA